MILCYSNYYLLRNQESLFPKIYHHRRCSDLSWCYSIIVDCLINPSLAVGIRCESVEIGIREGDIIGVCIVDMIAPNSQVQVKKSSEFLASHVFNLLPIAYVLIPVKSIKINGYCSKILIYHIASKCNQGRYLVKQQLLGSTRVVHLLQL